METEERARTPKTHAIKGTPGTRGEDVHAIAALEHISNPVEVVTGSVVQIDGCARELLPAHLRVGRV